MTTGRSTTLSNRYEIHSCFSSQSFWKAVGAQCISEPFRSQCLKTADEQTLGRKAANTHNETGKPTFSSMAL